MNTNEALENVRKYIKAGEAKKARTGRNPQFYIRDICDDLGIFDWWNDYMSLSQLKQMQSFLETAHELGYDGYVCFKVGAKYCANGMWAHKKESTTGYSPDGACLYHSFVSGQNYWCYCDDNNEWHHDELSTKEIKKLFLA